MELKVLLQLLARPWLIEETQAHYWAGIAEQVLFHKRLDAIPNKDTRSDAWGLLYEFPRVDTKGNHDPAGPVQLVRIEGPVMKYDYCGSMGMESLQQGIRAAAADNSIKSIVLMIDSPGGTADGTHNLAREISKVQKPVVAFVNGMMCSAAYWIGSGASEVIADDANNGYNATIGSIGAMASWIDRSKQEEAQGIKRHYVFASKSKRKGAHADQANSGDYTRLIQELDNLNETFLQAVKANRKGKLKMDEEDVLEGDVYDGRQAVKYGLIDRVADFQYALKRSLQMAKTIRS